MVKGGVTEKSYKNLYGMANNETSIVLKIQNLCSLLCFQQKVVGFNIAIIIWVEYDTNINLHLRFVSSHVQFLRTADDTKSLLDEEE